MQELSKAIKGTMVLAPVAATSANQTSASIDMSNFEGALFVANIGTAAGAALCTLTAQTGASTTAFVALSGGTAASSGGADDGYLAINVFRPRKRYLRCTLTNATTANIEYGGIMVYQYGAKTLPTTWSSTEAVSTLTNLVSADT